MKMKNTIYPVAIALTLMISAFTLVNVVTWKIKDGYAIKFSGSDAEGVFTSFKGLIQFDETDLASSKFVVELDVKSIDTGNGMKNRHAKSDNWFDADKYPTITFNSTFIAKTANAYSAIGKLKIHGIEKDVTIPFTFNNNIFSGSFTVNRLDYQVGSDKGMSAKVSNEIKIDINVPVTK